MVAYEHSPQVKDSVADYQDCRSIIESMVILRVILHVVIFAAAILVFALGLGVGLALNPAIGTLLWLVAGLIAVANVVWIVGVIRRR